MKRKTKLQKFWQPFSRGRAVFLCCFTLFIFYQQCAPAKWRELTEKSPTGPDVQAVVPNGGGEPPGGEPACRLLSKGHPNRVPSCSCEFNPSSHDCVKICHIPPGEPENQQTIVIDRSALGTHVEHHDDYVGECRPLEDNTCAIVAKGEFVW